MERVMRMREIRTTIPGDLPVDEPAFVTRHGHRVAVILAIPGSVEPADFARGLAARAVELREASEAIAKPAKKQSRS